MLVEATVEEGQGSPGAGALEGCGADQLEVAPGLGLCEEVVELVPHLSLRFLTFVTRDVGGRKEFD